MRTFTVNASNGATIVVPRTFAGDMIRIVLPPGTQSGSAVAPAGTTVNGTPMATVAPLGTPGLPAPPTFQVIDLVSNGYPAPNPILVTWVVLNPGPPPFLVVGSCLVRLSQGAVVGAASGGMSTGAKTALVATGVVAAGVGSLALAGASSGKGAGYFFGAAAEEAMAAGETARKHARSIR